MNDEYQTKSFFENNNKMKQLELTIETDKVKLSQVHRSDKGYVYERLNKESDIVESYEAFFHKENSYFNCVSYPTDNAFGKWAWCYSSLSKTAKQDAINKISQ